MGLQFIKLIPKESNLCDKSVILISNKSGVFPLFANDDLVFNLYLFVSLDFCLQSFYSFVRSLITSEHVNVVCDFVIYNF